MPTNIADEFGDIGKRLREIAGNEGRKVALTQNKMYWCYRHGTLTGEQTGYYKDYTWRLCIRSSCGRPVLRYCEVCDCEGWVGSRQCTDCGNPFDMKAPYE